ncbi:MAG TPA: hypothetical protein DD670_05045 [Planctomycetaceae bacterium]|nr:hypothetical protein [Planctomycetaceae bacterium]
MRRRRSQGAIFLACMLVTALAGAFPRHGLAHRPLFTDDKATSAKTAIPVANPTISQVVYREITRESPRVWLALDVAEGFELFVQIGVPVLDRLKGFRPAMAIVGPGLSKDDRPFELPKDTGARVLVTGHVEKPRFFHEHFTGTDSWILRSETVILPKAGRYYLVAYSPDDQSAETAEEKSVNRGGKLWLSVGKKESFTLRDLIDFPTWRRKIQAFHEVHRK